MPNDWSGKSKGSPLGYKIFFFLMKKSGLSSAYFLLNFVSFYYLIFSWSTNKQLKKFYKKSGLPANLKSIYANYKQLGLALIDKFYSFLVDQTRFKLNSTGREYFKEIVEQKNGGIVLMAHFGNWNIGGADLVENGYQMNMLMLDAEREQLKSLFQAKGIQPNFKVIPLDLGGFGHLFAIKKALDNNEFVCLMADRVTDPNQTISTTFFGQEIKLPRGPFEMIKVLKRPYLICCNVRTGKGHYDFFATKPSESYNVQEIADYYASNLEKFVRKNPEQWFNYHDFYKI